MRYCLRLLKYSSLAACALWVVVTAQLFLFRVVSQASTRPESAAGGDLLDIFAVVVLGPLIEELIFRFGLLRALMKWISPSVAIPLSALAFAAFHPQILSGTAAAVSELSVVFTGGLALGFIYLRSRTLLAPIAVHMTYNALSFMPTQYLYDIEALSPNIIVALSISVAAIGTYAFICATNAIPCRSLHHHEKTA